MLPMIRERSAALVVRFALCLLFPALLLQAQPPAHPQAAPHTPEYPLGVDSQPHADVPKGTVTKYELPAGRFYPGTPHTYRVYVPAQYDAAKPAPLMIFLDGGSFLSNGVRVPVVVRLEGTNADKAREMLSQSGLKITSAADLSDAARKVVALAAKGKA